MNVPNEFIHRKHRVNDTFYGTIKLFSWIFTNLSIVVWKNILGQTIDYRNAYRREVFFVEKLFLKHIFFYIFIEHKESNLIRFEYPFDSIVIFWQPISLRFWLNPWIYTLCKIIKKKKIIQSFYFSNKKKEEEKCRKVKRKRKFFVISQHKLLGKKLTF